MESWAFPVLLLIVAAIITAVDKIPTDWKKVAFGVMVFAMIADSLIEGLRALFR